MYTKQERKPIKATLTRDEIRRKREDKLSGLRKQKREELLWKKRRAEAEPIVEPRVMKQLENMPKLLQQLRSNNVHDQLEATITLRKILSIERNPPIESVVAAGVHDILVPILNSTTDTQLQFEACWVLTNICSGASEYVEKVVQANAIPVLIRLLNSPQDDIKEQAAWTLGNIAGDSPKFRDILLQHGVFEPLLRVITTTKSVSTLRNATWTLSNLCRGKPSPDFNVVSHAIPVLKWLLSNPDEEVIADTLWTFSYLTDGPNHQIQAVIESNVVPTIVEMLKSPQTSIQIPALRTVGNIVTGTDFQTQVVIQAGALPHLGRLLLSSRKSIRKEACWTISNITAGNREQIQAVIHHNLFPSILHVLRRDDIDIKREAAYAIANATSGATPEQIKYLVNIGCISPLCDLLSLRDVRIVKIGLEAIENILEAGELEAEERLGVNPYAELFERAECLEKIEALQTHEDTSIYETAVRILEVYFGAVEEPEAFEASNIEPDTGESAGPFQF